MIDYTKATKAYVNWKIGSEGVSAQFREDVIIQTQTNHYETVFNINVYAPMSSRHLSVRETFIDIFKTWCDLAVCCDCKKLDHSFVCAKLCASCCNLFIKTFQLTPCVVYLFYSDGLNPSDHQKHLRAGFHEAHNQHINSIYTWSIHD